MARAGHQASLPKYKNQEWSEASGYVIKVDTGRYLVDLAVKELGHWRVDEAWLADGAITLINDLGEGLPLPV